MNRAFQWAIAAALICGASVFTSCSGNDDNPATPDLNLSEKIIGKWVMATDFDGQPALTNNKEVITFLSSTKAYASRSRGDMNGGPQAPNPQDTPEGQGAPEGASEPMPGAGGWDDYQECDVMIDGNTVILTSEGPNGTTNTVKYIIKSISESEFTCEVVRDAPGGMITPLDGEVEVDGEIIQRFVRVTADYSAAILGLWECQGITGGET
ncbi:MAG: hypothetical protein J5593_02790, partial [Bacteroidaceae bacterium]|nr:hypothetical protein [Bacteroidaceae bacterium]